ncbi:MAG: putative Ig domain-containing protein [Planctomycetes bacterium]|nr:putative Ig domain-containing protein [Planctomycetota bacterium]
MTTLRALPVFLGCLLALLLQVGCTKKDNPVITSAGTATGQVGVPFTFTVTATNSPSAFGVDPATPLPAGLAIAPTTGVISGTPTAAGTTTVTVTAGTFSGKVGSGTLVITIAAGTVTTGSDFGIDVADGAPGNDVTAPGVNHRVTIMADMQGTNWTKTSSGGPGGTDLFSQPVAVCRDSSGLIYHLDATLNRVVRMNNSGGITGFVTYGSTGSGRTQLLSPRGMCIDSNNRIYIADTGNNRIVRLSDISDTNPVIFPDVGITTPFNSPSAIFADANGKVYVADTFNNRIVTITDMTQDVPGSGFTQFLGQGSGLGSLNQPSGISVDGQFRIYVADTGNNRIVRIDNITGANFTALPPTDAIPGSSIGRFQNPVGIYTSHSGKTYVADTGNNRIVSFEGMTTTGWTPFGSRGTQDTGYFNPTGIFVRQTPFAIGRVEHAPVAPLGVVVVGR